MTTNPAHTAIVRLCNQIHKLIDLQHFPPEDKARQWESAVKQSEKLIRESLDLLNPKKGSRR